MAAVAVAVYHVYLIFLQKFGTPTFEVVSQYGQLGVPYFFVLSGFIITHAHWKDLGNAKSIPTYFYRRFVRVYPVYWIFSIVFVIAALVGFGDAELDPRWSSIVENIALIHFTPDFTSPPLKVAWTLFYEIRFYLLFGIAIINPRIGAVLGACWVLACLLLKPFNAFTTELLSFWSFAFLFGILAALAYKRFSPKAWLVCGGLGLILCASILLGDAMDLRSKRSWFIIPVSAGFALVVLSQALREKQTGSKTNRIGKLLGDASYSLYLVHSAAISAAVIIISRLGLQNTLPHAVLFIPVLIGAIIVGVLAHLVVEKPLMKALRRPKRHDAAEVATAKA
jgi:exopolysaccharide production protein ExoZ